MNLFYLYGHLIKPDIHNVGLWHQDLHHGPDDSLLPILNTNPWDIVGIGAVAGYYQYRKLKSLSNVINSSTRRHKFQYVLGGHGPAAAPEYFMRVMGADSVVVGDGEDGFDQILSVGKGVIHTKPCTEDAAPLRVYQAMPMDIYKLIRWPTSERTDFAFRSCQVGAVSSAARFVTGCGRGITYGRLMRSWRRYAFCISTLKLITFSLPMSF